MSGNIAMREPTTSRKTRPKRLDGVQALVSIFYDLPSTSSARLNSNRSIPGKDSPAPSTYSKSLLRIRLKLLEKFLVSIEPPRKQDNRRPCEA